MGYRSLGALLAGWHISQLTEPRAPGSIQTIAEVLRGNTRMSGPNPEVLSWFSTSPFLTASSHKENSGGGQHRSPLGNNLQAPL